MNASMGTLSLGNVLNAGFVKIFNMYSPLTYSTGDIIDIYVYRQSLVNGQYSFGTAVGLFKSVIALCMQPEIMLFDEVTVALDPEMVREVLDTKNY